MTAGLVPIHVGVVSKAFVYLPLWVGQRRGIFQALGLDVTAEVLGSGDNVTAALKTGAAQIGMTTPEGAIIDRANGGRLEIIAGNSNKLLFSLVARPHFHGIDELRGATIGVSSLNEGTTFILQEILTAHGLHAPGDYRLSVVGTHPIRWQLLQEGTIDAGLQLIPFNYMAEDAGYSILADAAQYVPDYLFTSVNVDSTWAEENAETVTAFLAALIRATDVMYDQANEAEMAEIAVAETETESRYAARAVSDIIANETVPKDLQAAPEALRKTILLVKQTGALDRDAPEDVSSYVNDRYRAGAVRG